MAKKRRVKSAKTRTTPTPPPKDQETEGSGPWKSMRAWMAGILGAVILVVFTAWFNARGLDALDEIRGEPLIKIGHVAVDHRERDTALREPVTDPGERAILLGGGSSGPQRDAVLDLHHTAPINNVNVTVVLVGNRTNLRIIDIKPRVLARKPVAEGALAFLSTREEADTIELAADLDAMPPRFTTKNRDVSYFSKKQIDLKRDERVTLTLAVTGKKAYYEFDFLVTVLAADKTEHIPIKGPFRLTGLADAYRSYYTASPLGGWRPISHDQACMRRELEGC